MYVTQQQLIDRFGETELVQLTDRDGTAGGIVVDVLDGAIADASAEADAYVGVRYELPMAVVPDALVRVVADMVRYRLYDDAAPEQVRKRYEDAVKFLRELAAGTVSIGALPAGSTLTAQGEAQMTSGGRTFSRDDQSFI